MGGYVCVCVCGGWFGCACGACACAHTRLYVCVIVRESGRSHHLKSSKEAKSQLYVLMQWKPFGKFHISSCLPYADVGWILHSLSQETECNANLVRCVRHGLITCIMHASEFNAMNDVLFTSLHLFSPSSPPPCHQLQHANHLEALTYLHQQLREAESDPEGVRPPVLMPGRVAVKAGELLHTTLSTHMASHPCDVSGEAGMCIPGVGKCRKCYWALPLSGVGLPCFVP